MKDLKTYKPVRLLWNPYGFYMVVTNLKHDKGYSKLRQKLLRSNVKWTYHITCTFEETTLKSLKELDRIGEIGISGKWIGQMCSQINDSFKNRGFSYKLKYFWKYEEGRKHNRPHFHLLINWNGYRGLVYHRFKRIWEDRWHMGKLWLSKIRNDIHLTNVLGYGAKPYAVMDLLKSSPTIYMVKGRKKYSFSSNIEFSEQKNKFYYKKSASYFTAMKNVEETADRLIKYYDNAGLDGKHVLNTQLKFLEAIKKMYGD